MVEDLPDDERFMQVAFWDREGTCVISAAAFQPHSFGVVQSVREGNPGIIGDDYLNGLTVETTLIAAELELEGLWERVDGGYRVLEQSIVAEAVRIHEAARSDNEELSP